MAPNGSSTMPTSLDYVWYCLLPAVPAAIIASGLGAGPLVTFPLAGLGIIPLAAYMGRATESLATHVGPRLGGLLSPASAMPPS